MVLLNPRGSAAAPFLPMVTDPRPAPIRRGWVRRLAALFLPAHLFLWLPSADAQGPLVINGETVWQGTVEVTDDVLVTANGHLTLLPGTRVLVRTSEGTKTDPQFYSTETEILVRGKLTAGRKGEASVTFQPAEAGGISWAGITVDGPRASASLEGVTVRGALAGLTVIDAVATAEGCSFTKGSYGVVLLGRGEATLRNCRLEENDYGLADFSGGGVLEASSVSGNREKDRLDRSPLDGYRLPDWWRLPYRLSRRPGETEYLGDQAINEDTVWEGRVTIRGQVAVQVGATLTIRPGTEVAFRKLDTNGDGIGESQLLVLGTLKVLGAPENWVLFTSAEKEPGPGDWDKLSLISSDSADNVVQYARFEYGYQAFHNHFSRASLVAVIFNDNYRGVQFQESPQTSVAGAWFTRNKSAMRFRDSKVDLADILVEGNVSGIHYLRCQLSLKDSVIAGNLLDPLLGRESKSRLSGVIVNGNREGPRFKGEGSTLDMDHSAVHRNLEDGVSMTGTTASLQRCDLSLNGLDGLSVTEGMVTVTGSDLSRNGRWALDNNGSSPVAARGNWWGTADPAGAGRLIEDGRRKEGIGVVDASEPLGASPGLFFSGSEPSSSDWGGPITVIGDFSWPPGRPLAILPGATVRLRYLSDLSPLDCCREHPSFSGTELVVSSSSVSVAGTEAAPIRFVGGDGAAPFNGGVNVVSSPQLTVAWSSFSGMATGLHVRESAGVIEHCLFEANEAGLRFNASRLAVRHNLFVGNGAGIRFHFGEPDIAGNAFRGNGKAIFVTDDPRGHTISGNNFSGSTEYDISLGEPVDRDVDARDNWWGGSDGREVGGKFFDGEIWPHLGRVVWKPAAAKAFPAPAVPAPSR